MNIKQSFVEIGKLKLIKDYEELINSLINGASFYYVREDFSSNQAEIINLHKVSETKELPSMGSGSYIQYFDTSHNEKNRIKDPLLLTWALMVEKHDVLVCDSDTSMPISIINGNDMDFFGKSIKLANGVDYYILEEQE